MIDKPPSAQNTAYPAIEEKTGRAHRMIGSMRSYVALGQYDEWQALILGRISSVATHKE
jgi:hypothetical protein